MSKLRKVPILMTESWRFNYSVGGAISVFKELSEQRRFKETSDDQVAAFLEFSDIEWLGSVSKPRKSKLSEAGHGRRVRTNAKRGPCKKRHRSLLVYTVSTEKLSNDVCVIATVESDFLRDSSKISYRRLDLTRLLDGTDLVANGCTPETPPEKFMALMLRGHKPTAQNFVFRPLTETLGRPGWWTLEVSADEYSLVYKGKATIYVQFEP